MLELCVTFDVQDFVADGQASSKDEGGISGGGSRGSITTGRVRFLPFVYFIQRLLGQKGVA